MTSQAWRSRIAGTSLQPPALPSQFIVTIRPINEIWHSRVMNLRLRLSIAFALIAITASACFCACVDDVHSDSTVPRYPDPEPCNEPPTVSLVCFGSSREEYESYLLPADGGWSVGQCPTTQDFDPGYYTGAQRSVSGPLHGLQDAGAGCCFEIEAPFLCN